MGTRRSNEMGAVAVAQGRGAQIVPQEELFDEVRNLVLRACQLLQGKGESGWDEVWAEARDTELCESLLEQLSQPFSFFVAGEFNVGKSSLINRIAGEDVAITGVLPTTSRLVPLRAAGLLFVDSPGLNSILKEHQEATEEYLGRSDFVLFVTSVERPLSDSEVQFLQQVRGRWDRKVIVVVNKADIASEEECAQVQRFVEDGLRSTLGAQVPVHLLSARTGAGVDAFEELIRSRLGETERVSAKLLAPLASLKVLLGELRAECTRAERRLQEEQASYDLILEQCHRRIREAALLFDGYADQGHLLFAQLAYRVGSIVDERFGLLPLLRMRITGDPDLYRGKIHQILSDLDFEGKLRLVVEGAARKLSAFRELLWSDVRASLSADGTPLGPVALPSGRDPVVDPQQIARDLRESAERGMNRFLALGSAAAASGLGAKLSTVAPLEVTAVVFMVGLGFFSFRALPRERLRVKEQIRSSFEELGQQFAASLSEGIRTQLDKAVEGVKAELSAPQQVISTRLLSVARYFSAIDSLHRDIVHLEERVQDKFDARSL